MKSFSFVENAASLIFLILYLPILTLSLIPGIYCVLWVFDGSESYTLFARVLAISLSLSAMYAIHQITMPLLCGIVYRILPLRYPVGNHPLHSWNGVKWASCTALHRVARQHFPLYSLPSWYVNIYYRLMGAKIGRGAHIATLLINDPQHVSIGSQSVVGGGSIINSHSVENGVLIVAENRIDDHATIGLNSILMAGVCVERSAIVGARSVVTKNQTVPAGEKWIGTPAKKVG